MLALARVLRMGARLLLCDEPTEGLSPLLVAADRRHPAARSSGTGVTVLLIEQNVHFATTVADRHYLLAEGRVVESLDNAEVRAREHELLDLPRHLTTAHDRADMEDDAEWTTRAGAAALAAAALLLAGVRRGGPGGGGGEDQRRQDRAGRAQRPVRRLRRPVRQEQRSRRCRWPSTTSRPSTATRR